MKPQDLLDFLALIGMNPQSLHNLSDRPIPCREVAVCFPETMAIESSGLHPALDAAKTTAALFHEVEVKEALRHAVGLGQFGEQNPAWRVSAVSWWILSSGWGGAFFPEKPLTQGEGQPYFARLATYGTSYTTPRNYPVPDPFG